MASPLESTHALALPNATSHFCRSCGDGALKYMCCCPGITKSSLVLSMVFTGKQVSMILYNTRLCIITRNTIADPVFKCFRLFNNL